MPSLKKYVLIEVFTKQKAYSSLSEKCNDPEVGCSLDAINYKTKLKQVYAAVTFKKDKQLHK